MPITEFQALFDPGQYVNTLISMLVEEYSKDLSFAYGENWLGDWSLLENEIVAFWAPPATVLRDLSSKRILEEKSNASRSRKDPAGRL